MKQCTHIIGALLYLHQPDIVIKFGCICLCLLGCIDISQLSSLELFKRLQWFFLSINLSAYEYFYGLIRPICTLFMFFSNRIACYNPA